MKIVLTQKEVEAIVLHYMQQETNIPLYECTLSPYSMDFCVITDYADKPVMVPKENIL